MHNDKMIKFVKQWREIEIQQRDLDFTKTQFANALRDEFVDGDKGDEQFINWCALELGLTSYESRQLLLRANVAKVVSDERTYKRLGGFRSVKHLEPLARKQRVEVLEAAKLTGKPIKTVLKERGFGPKPKPPNTFRVDAETMAAYLSRVPKLPKNIEKIVRRYVEEPHLKAVA